MKNLWNMTGGYGQSGMQDNRAMNGQQRPGGFQGARGYQGRQDGRPGGQKFNNRGRNSAGNNMRSAGGNRENMQGYGAPPVNPAAMQMTPEQMAQMQFAQ